MHKPRLQYFVNYVQVLIILCTYVYTYIYIHKYSTCEHLNQWQTKNHKTHCISLQISSIHALFGKHDYFGRKKTNMYPLKPDSRLIHTPRHMAFCNLVIPKPISWWIRPTMGGGDAMIPLAWPSTTTLLMAWKTLQVWGAETPKVEHRENNTGNAWLAVGRVCWIFDFGAYFSLQTMVLVGGTPGCGMPSLKRTRFTKSRFSKFFLKAPLRKISCLNFLDLKQFATFWTIGKVTFIDEKGGGFNRVQNLSQTGFCQGWKHFFLKAPSQFNKQLDCYRSTYLL